MSRHLLLLALALAACKRPNTDGDVPRGTSSPTRMYVQSSTAKLREGPDDKATDFDRLQIGTAVVVSELGPAWVRVSAGHASGWVSRDTLGSEPPTLEWAIAKHDAVPLEDVASRRSWAERAAALAPDDVGALERLIAALERTGDKEALARARRGLEGVRENLSRNAIAGIVVQDGAAARARPAVDSDLVQTFRAGDIVRAFRDSQTDPAARVFVAVLAKGRKAWMALDALLVPDVHQLCDNQAPQASILRGGGFGDKLLANGDVAARRLAARAIFGRLAGEVLSSGGEGGGNASGGCDLLMELWSTLQRDPDAEVRQAANDGLLQLDEPWNVCLHQQIKFRDQLGAMLARAKPALTEAERKQLDRLFTGQCDEHDRKACELRQLLNP